MSGPGAFPDTRWTLILASRAGPEARAAALAELLALYWKPLYVFARRKGLAEAAAEDAVQGLCARLLETDFLDRVDADKGRLRSYLRTALANHLASEHERAVAAKRGGGARHVSIDTALLERGLATAPADPAAALDREWAEGVMERALAALAGEFARGERSGPFSLVEEFFRLGGEPPPYAEAAGRHGMTVAGLKSFLHRARLRYRKLVRDELAHTVADPTDPAQVDDELRVLMETLGA